ncbi:DNA mismatch repair protein [Piedraia hortae CBS 480.64]|uniref:DNA mismatch repair protein n=1 Tax=Piedraia hortae CBS 480.64 TaxID=1314780 RepID=A0A6A7C6W8_9PEZI|nr:DNA mismatch repair protein [Piedraia hortae CBS 480.64]
MGNRPELKVEDETGFIKAFSALSRDKDEKTVRIFDRGDYLSAHGTDALLIARHQYKTTSVIKTLGRSPGLPSVTMTWTVYKNFLREAIFRLGKRVEIYSSTGRNQWALAKQASPGNLQDIEDELGGNIESAPIILAVKASAKADARQVGVCFADASVRELGVSEFVDNDIYSNFESLLIQLGVRECLIQDGSDPDLQKLCSIAENCGCAVSKRPPGDFGSRDVEQDLARLLRDEVNVFHSDLKLAMNSAAALIKYLDIMTDTTNYGQYRLYQHELSQYMKLDSSALKALNLMPGPKDSSKTMNLYGLLNHCKTPLGSRLLSQWLKQPLMSLEEIGKRQQLVEAFFTDTELRQVLQEQHLRYIPDLYRLAKKFQREKATLEDVVRVYQVIIRLPDIIDTYENIMDEAYKDVLDQQYTDKLRSISNQFSGYQEMVETTVDLDALDNHEFAIKPDFEEGLKVLKKLLDEARTKMNKEHRKVADDLNVEADKKLFLENNKGHGFCFRLTRAEASIIRNKKPYMELATQKNGVFFTTPTLSALKRDFDQLTQNYNRTQSGLVREVLKIAAGYTPVIEHLASVLSHMDVIISLAHAAVHAPVPYVRPKIHPREDATGITELKEARHPCMEAQSEITFIANDFYMSRRQETGEDDNQSNEGNPPSFLLITGPNMGGKSTYIRTLGVISLLAQVGSFVPCTSATLCIHDSILARVGASDSQLHGVSTFMAEMLETANILKSATRESLVIIDELGRGTSTYDGFGLAWAISEYLLTETKCLTLFATHFHELAALRDKFPQVGNLRVVAHFDNDNEDVTLLYKVEEGVSEKSFGINVAELVKFPKKVVNMAKWRAGELENFASSTSAGAEVAADEKEVEEGCRLLKEILVKWKEDNAGAAVDEKLQVEKLRELIKGNEELMGNKFFERVRLEL